MAIPITSYVIVIFFCYYKLHEPKTRAFLAPPSSKLIELTVQMTKFNNHSDFFTDHVVLRIVKEMLGPFLILKPYFNNLKPNSKHFWPELAKQSNGM